MNSHPSQNARAKCENCIHHRPLVRRPNTETADVCVRIDMRACTWERSVQAFPKHHPLPNCGPDALFYSRKTTGFSGSLIGSTPDIAT